MKNNYPKYYVSAKGFIDETAYVEFVNEKNGYGFTKSGWSFPFCDTEDFATKMVERGSWEEISFAEARELVHNREFVQYCIVELSHPIVYKLISDKPITISVAEKLLSDKYGFRVYSDVLTFIDEPSELKI